jgi:hypothetical protein
MVTKQNTKPGHNIEGLPAEWADAEVLAGVSVVDKDSLVGKLFLVTAVKQTFASAGYPMAWVEGQFPDGNTFTFNDSSATSGVRVDVEEILKLKNKADVLDEWISIRFICPEGLRISRYEKEDNRGKLQAGRSFYLTRSGVRADA